MAPILTGDYSITNADFKVPIGVSQTNLAKEPGAIVAMSTTESFTDPVVGPLLRFTLNGMTEHTHQVLR